MEATKKQVGGGHYKDMKIQPVEFIQANGIPFIEGCVIKYVCRHKSKNGKQDIEKAIHFLELLLGLEYSENTEGEKQETKNHAIDGLQMLFNDIRHRLDSRRQHEFPKGGFSSLSPDTEINGRNFPFAYIDEGELIRNRRGRICPVEPALDWDEVRKKFYKYFHKETPDDFDFPSSQLYKVRDEEKQVYTGFWVSHANKFYRKMENGDILPIKCEFWRAIT
jgi:hypothetical protein